MAIKHKFVAHEEARHEIYSTPSGKLRIIQNPRPRNGRAFFKDITTEEAASFESWTAYKARTTKKVQTGTCQICGRAIGNGTGKIAHHGYRRPLLGSGWQTSSCSGAKHLPFEEDRTILGEHIDWLALTLKSLTLRHTAVSAEGFDEKLIGFRSKKIGDTFEVSKGDPLWDTLRHEKLAQLRRDIETLPAEIERQQKRHDAWKPKA